MLLTGNILMLLTPGVHQKGIGLKQSVTAATQEVLDQAERIAASSLLHNAESLCNLLRFLVKNTVEPAHPPLKEHQIAVEVFHRPVGFDPRLDSTVRVQTSRLRSKLAEYYTSTGSTDRVILEIPKGTYAVVARQREPVSPTVTMEPVQDHAPPKSSILSSFGNPPGWVWWVTTAMLVCLAAAITYAMMRPSNSPLAASPVSVAARRFWGLFFHGTEKPLVVYSNAEFVGRPETGLRYRDPGSPDSNGILDHYTGVGEVMAVHELTLLFGQLGRPFSVKRGRLLNWDDTKERDLIFIGSPSENLSLRELAIEADFRFETVPEGPRKGDLGIVNAHPQVGEQPIYLASRSLPVTEDYAIVSLFMGPSRPQSILLLAGTTTFGTHGAAEFITSDLGIQEILRRLPPGALRPFAVLLRVSVKGGVPVDSKVIAWRLTSPR